MVYHRLSTDFHQSLQETSKARSNTLGSPVGGGGFNRFAHSAGPGPWVEGPWRRSLQRGKVNNMVATSLQNGSKIVPKWHQHGCQMGSGSPLEASWRSLGALKRLGRRRGGFQGLMGRAWTPLGTLLGPKKVVLNGSWPLQEEFQERFQPSWGPKGSQKGAKRVPKTRSKSDSS